MVKGALHIKTSIDLLKKFKYEVSQFKDNPKNGCAVLNAIRDGYHLREWIWHEYIKNKHDNQKILAVKNEKDFNKLINSMFPDFPILRELCNGSKHMRPDEDSKIKDSFLGGYGTQPYGISRYGMGGFFVKMNNENFVEVNAMVENLLGFWEKFFADQGF